MVDSLATFALETLRDLLIEEARFLSGVSSQVEQVQRDLKTMHSLLMDADKWSNKYSPATLHAWNADLKVLAFEAENVLEEYAVEVISKRDENLMKKLKRFTCISNESWSVHQVGEKTKAIRSRLTDLTARLGSIVERSSNSTDDQQNLSRLTYAHEVEEHFIGMEEDIKRVLSLVVEEGERCNPVISICGMGGLGKTTVARKIYQHEDVKHCFEARAWVCATQQFQAKTILKQILRQILLSANPSDKEVSALDRKLDTELSELVEELHKCLMLKKCLIVIDDIWEIDHWNSIKKAFPIVERRCNVLLTTRNEKIAFEEGLHKLGCLTEDQSWELLRKIAFPRNKASVIESELSLLEDIGRQMVKKCGRLPLAISVIGGILRHKHTLGEWKMVKESIDSYLKHGEGVEDDKRVDQVLDLSYNVLPYYLKACFLYLGCFGEDEEIGTEQLYLLWMAEGLISSEDKGSGESFRDVAERYLSELAFRCMVQVKKNETSSPYEKFGSCRLHDLMHDLCLSKVKKEGFYKVIDCEKSTNCVPLDGTISRLAIRPDGDLDDCIDEIEKLKGLRSLLVLWNTSSDIETTVGSRDCVIIFNKLKFLRILVLEHCDFKSKKLPSEVGKLIHLRYLSLIRSKVENLPLSVCNLLYLQTLDLRVWSHDIKLPNVFYKIKRLRHLFFPHDFGEVISVNGERLILDGLRELETLVGFDSRCFHAEDIPKLTNLRKLDAHVHDDIYSLSVIVDHMHDNNSQLRETHFHIWSCDFSSENGSNIFRKMLMSPSLISLEVNGCIGCSLPCNQPGMCTNLVALTLEDSKIEGDVMEILGKFPMLKSLVLVGEVLVNTPMICRATSFPQLKFLFLWKVSNLEKWEVEKGAMPNLFLLRIHTCNNLEMIPDGLSFITTLQELTCLDMPKEFNDRLRVVNDKQGQDYHKVCHIPDIYLTDNDE